MEILSKRLKWLREQKRLSQKEVAAEIGITHSGYQKLEYNEREPKLEVLIKFASFYKTTSDFLLGISDEYGELKEFQRQITIKEMKVTKLEMETVQINHEFRRSQQQLIMLKNKYNSLGSSIKEREMVLKSLEERKEKLETELFHAQMELYDQVGVYVGYLIEIPGAKPWLDAHIKKYHIEAEDARHEDGSNFVYLTNATLSYSYYFKDCDSKEEAIELAEKINSLIRDPNDK